MALIVYGIPNCDTVKKARAWLLARGRDHVFHDYKKAGVPETRLRAWVADLGWETLVNRSGTTFRNLPDAAKADLDSEKAIALMIANPSVIRRPVIEGTTSLLVGFKPDSYEAAGL